MKCPKCGAGVVEVPATMPKGRFVWQCGSGMRAGVMDYESPQCKDNQIARLQETVDECPTTADGVHVIPTRTAVFVNTKSGVVQTNCWTENGNIMADDDWYTPRQCYSTEAAAREAATPNPASAGGE